MGLFTHYLCACILLLSYTSSTQANDVEEILVTDIRELITHMLGETTEKDIKCIGLVCDLAGNKPFSTACEDLKHAYEDHQDLQPTIERGFLLITQHLITLTAMPTDERNQLIDLAYAQDPITRERLHSWQWPEA